MTSTRIEICGGVASGKTTLCHLLSTHGLQPGFEKFSENPFWRHFYQNPRLYAFEAEITFLLQHYSQIKTSCQSSLATVFDYSLLQDIAYARVNLRDAALSAFGVVYKYVTAELPPPVLITYLQCSPQEELVRIQNRGRDEERSVQLSYLEAINVAIADAVNETRSSVPIVEIDSGTVDFLRSRVAQVAVVSQVMDAIG